LDRSRKIYAIPPGASRPVFLCCAPEILTPGEGIGLVQHKGELYAILNRLKSGGTEPKYRTEIIRILTGEGNLVEAKRSYLSGTAHFTAAHADMTRQKLYLAEGNKVFEADLSRRRPAPKLLAELQVLDALHDLRIDTVRNWLFASDRGGRMQVLDLTSNRPPVLVAEGLGWPEYTALDPERNRIYVSDMEHQQIWQITCTGDIASWSAPDVFVKSEEFRAPVGLSVDRDGILWIGDLEAQAIYTVSPEGRILRTVRSLSSIPAQEASGGGEKSSQEEPYRESQKGDG